MDIIIFILVLGVLVFVHELGHFLVAKKSGIKVEEFGIGFPPKLFSFTKGETTYSLNLIPFGGFVKIFGENPMDLEGKEGSEDFDRSMSAKPKFVQAMVLLAGIVFNIIFAWLLFSAVFMTGSPTLATEDNRDQLSDVNFAAFEVLSSSPAENAGLQAGDQILSLSNNGERVEGLDFESFSAFVNQNPENLIIEFQRGGQTMTADLTANFDSEEDRHMIGASLSEVGIKTLPVHQALWQGLERTFYLTEMILVGIGQLLYSTFTGQGEVLEQVSGPVGIFDIVSQTADTGIAYLLSLVALISINLAILNLLPFPALDGGRLLFLLIEYIKGSPINPQTVATFNLIGFLFLILLMLIVTYNDVIRLFA